MRNRKAIIESFGGPSVIRIDTSDVPEPLVGQARIKIEASTVSGTDIFIRKGIYPLLKTKPPLTLGYDFVGLIDKIPGTLTGLNVGDRVCGFDMTGGNADYLCVEHSKLTVVPHDIDVIDAACLSLSGITAFQMFKHYAKIKRGQRILIHGGSGAIGDTLLQLGRLHQCKMVSTASLHKHKTIESYGAVAIDYRAADYKMNLHEHAGDGFDAIFDFTNQNSFNTDMKLLKNNGTLVTYAVFTSSLNIVKKSFFNFIAFGADFGLMMLKLMYWNRFSGKNAVFYGSTDSRAQFPKRYQQDMAELFALVSQNQIKPVAYKVLCLEEVAEAHKILQNGEVQGQIVIKN